MRFSRYTGTGGLSPPVRGNRDLDQLRNEILRSIPACAGEPMSGLVSAGNKDGLSPPVRGNQCRR